MLPASYVDQGVIYAEKRLVTAGYRLANLIKSLTIKSVSEVEEEALTAKLNKQAEETTEEKEANLFLQE